MTATYDLDLTAGETTSFSINYADPDGNAIDLTGYTAAMHGRDTRDSTDTIFSLSSEGGTPGIVLGDTNPNIEVSIGPAVTQDKAPMSGFYDLRLTSAGGEVTFLVAGRFTIRRPVTRG